MDNYSSIGLATSAAIEIESVQTVLPSRYTDTDDASALVRLLEEYYKFMNQRGGPSYNIQTLTQQHDFDSADDEYIEAISQIIAKNIPTSRNLGKRELLKIIVDYYRNRGSEDSIREFFRIFYGELCQLVYPNEFLQSSSDDKSVIDGDKDVFHVQDSYKWQTFSYIVSTPVPTHLWRQEYKDFIHPAGLLFFVKVAIEMTNNNLWDPDVSKYIQLWDSASDKIYVSFNELDTGIRMSIWVKENDQWVNGRGDIISDDDIIKLSDPTPEEAEVLNYLRANPDSTLPDLTTAFPDMTSSELSALRLAIRAVDYDYGFNDLVNDTFNGMDPNDPDDLWYFIDWQKNPSKHTPTLQPTTDLDYTFLLVAFQRGLYHYLTHVRPIPGVDDYFLRATYSVFTKSLESTEDNPVVSTFHQEFQSTGKWLDGGAWGGGYQDNIISGPIYDHLELNPFEPWEETRQELNEVEEFNIHPLNLGTKDNDYIAFGANMTENEVKFSFLNTNPFNSSRADPSDPNSYVQYTFGTGTKKDENGQDISDTDPSTGSNPNDVYEITVNNSSHWFAESKITAGQPETGYGLEITENNTTIKNQFHPSGVTNLEYIPAAYPGLIAGTPVPVENEFNLDNY